MEKNKQLGNQKDVTTSHHDYWSSNYGIAVGIIILFLGATGMSCWMIYRLRKIKKGMPTFKISAKRLHQELENTKDDGPVPVKDKNKTEQETKK